MEIEKKFKVVRMPEHLEQYPCRVIEQAYLCTKPILRIRKSNEDFILTLKDKQGTEEMQTVGTGIVSREIEIPLTEEAYVHLKVKADGFVVEKHRYLIPLEGDLTAELDVFDGRLAGLCFVEVEFPDVEAARTFQPPDWMGEDISDDHRYRNSFLAGLED